MLIVQAREPEFKSSSYVCNLEELVGIGVKMGRSGPEIEVQGEAPGPAVVGHAFNPSIQKSEAGGY